MSIDLRDVTAQPYFASVLRAVEKLKLLGQPLSAEAYERLATLAKSGSSTALIDADSLLAPYTLAHLVVDADGRVKATAGLAPRNLVEQGWKAFLIRVENPHRLEDDLEALVGWRRWGARQFNLEQRPALLDTINPAPIVESLWLELKLEEKPQLSGFEIEYRVIELCSRDRGKRQTRLSFGVGRGGSYPHKQAEWNLINTQGLELGFTCAPSHNVTVRVADADGRTCVAAIT
jgi:hypothetical protein